MIKAFIIHYQVVEAQRKYFEKLETKVQNFTTMKTKSVEKVNKKIRRKLYL
jgi:hypothetical protein